MNAAPSHVLTGFTEMVVDCDVTVSMARPVIQLVEHVTVTPATMGKIAS